MRVKEPVMIYAPYSNEYGRSVLFKKKLDKNLCLK